MDYPEDWAYVIKRIRQLREAKSWSLQALADYANMDRANLSRIEAGQAVNMYFSTLCKIAEALEVSPGELIRK